MRKIIALLLLMAVTLVSYAQTDSEHLSFKGIPIKGNVSEFCEQLANKGFTYIRKTNHVSALQGEFVSYNATIVVTSYDTDKNIFAVSVLFDSCCEWNALVNTYNYLKDLYTRKYGSPIISKEYSSAFLDSNAALMAAIHQGTFIWSNTWSASGGNIVLSIEKTSNRGEGMVVVRYRNYQDIETKIQNNLEDI